MSTSTTVAVSDYTDLVTTTLKHFQRIEWSELAQDLQQYTAMRHLLTNKVKTVPSGEQYSFNARFYSNDAARNVQPGQPDDPSFADLFAKGNVPWRFTETHWALEERFIAINRNPDRLVELLRGAMIDSMVSLASQLEENFWNAPTSATDALAPYGIPYWIVKNSTEGFTGGRTFSGSGAHPGNLDPNTYGEKWKNWSNTYTSVARDDLLRKWRKAATKTNFIPPVAGPYANVSHQAHQVGANYGPGMGNMPGFMFCCGYDVLGPLEEILENQNENLMKDLAPYDGQVHFRKIPVTYVPYLDDNDTQDPVYGINWKSFFPVFLAGEYMRPSKIMYRPNQHRTIVQYHDNAYNFVCNDRRAQFVLYINQ